MILHQKLRKAEAMKNRMVTSKVSDSTSNNMSLAFVEQKSVVTSCLHGVEVNIHGLLEVTSRPI